MLQALFGTETGASLEKPLYERPIYLRPFLPFPTVAGSILLSKP